MGLMDWGAIASILAERNDHPIALLDKTGRVRLFNRGMEHVLGWTRFQVDGQPWARICAAPEAHDDAERWIAEALRGALRHYETVAITSSGTRVALRLEFSLVGRGAAQGLLVTVIESTPVQTVVGPLESQDLDYEVSLAADKLGVITRVNACNGPVPLHDHQTHCYSLIHGREGPCEECPVLRLDDAPWPRVSVQHRLAGAAKIFEIKTAEKLDAARARIRLRLLPENTLDAIHAAKVDELAERADLSPREREVLSYLLLGRVVEDIAQLIGIASRTVKYHQANVLQKLGAESRADLLRLLF